MFKPARTKNKIPLNPYKEFWTSEEVWYANGYAITFDDYGNLYPRPKNLYKFRIITIKNV